MNDSLVCPQCHQPLAPTDFFCGSCGRKIRAAPLSTSFPAQIILYLKTLLLPPLGLWWGYKYLRQSDTRSKIVGLIVIVVTIVEIGWSVQFTANLVTTVNQQINQQTQLYGL